ncbi:DUF4367 domain-containing protein [Paenibacillus sp. FSL M8-0142]|uniref:DUF4367 domain-containing protein n=1 Tax=Paenibacillus sp. FSL M8-0142 TaxID=2954525 RepID=UPI00315A5A4F
MSNEKYDDWFNEAFDEAFDRAASSSSYPTNDDSKRQSWQQVKMQLEKLNQRKKHRRRFQYAGIVAASMAFGAFMFSQPTVTQAVSPIYQQIVDWGNGLAGQIFGKKAPVDESKALTPPPPDVSSVPGQEYVPPAELIETETYEFTDSDASLTESQKRVNFKIPEVGYIPNGYEFIQASGISNSEDGPIEDLKLEYMNGDGKVIHVSFIEITADKAISVGGEVTGTLKLDSGAAAYITETNLRFLHNNDQILVMISGFISKEEFLKIANGIR